MKQLPKFKNRKWIYHGKKVSLSIDTFRLGQVKLKREIIHHPGAVVIIPRLPDGRILLIRQYRYPSRKVLWELPAGTRDVAGGRVESARACAAREIQEEVGFRARSLKKLCGFYLAPGTSTEYMDVFLAERLIKSPLPADADEIIEPKALPLPMILKMIRKGVLQDAKTITALFYYDAFKRTSA
jgi:ADP-ribose pyrophosphatase